MACTVAGPLSPRFFLWGYLKACVHRNRPRTLRELKSVIRDETATVSKEVLLRVLIDFVNGLRECVANEGGQFQDAVCQK
jgi:hypothetical protein